MKRVIFIKLVKSCNEYFEDIVENLGITSCTSVLQVSASQYNKNYTTRWESMNVS